MLIMTYSDARKNFSSFLNQAKKDGKALIRRSDGSEFEVIPVDNKKQKKSPFAKVQGINTEISVSDILQILHEGREQRADEIIKKLPAQKEKAIENFFAKLKNVEL